MSVSKTQDSWGSSWGSRSYSSGLGSGPFRRKATNFFRKIFPAILRRQQERSERATREPVHDSILSGRERTRWMREGHWLVIWDSIRMNHETFDADRKSTRLNSSHSGESRMPSSA